MKSSLAGRFILVLVIALATLHAAGFLIWIHHRTEFSRAHLGVRDVLHFLMIELVKRDDGDFWPCLLKGDPVEATQEPAGGGMGGMPAPQGGIDMSGFGVGGMPQGMPQGGMPPQGMPGMMPNGGMPQMGMGGM